MRMMQECKFSTKAWLGIVKQAILASGFNAGLLKECVRVNDYITHMSKRSHRTVGVIAMINILNNECNSPLLGLVLARCNYRAITIKNIRK